MLRNNEVADSRTAHHKTRQAKCYKIYFSFSVNSIASQNVFLFVGNIVLVSHMIARTLPAAKTRVQILIPFQSVNANLEDIMTR
jgi:hypothetical protein